MKRKESKVMMEKKRHWGMIKTNISEVIIIKNRSEVRSEKKQ